MKNCCLSLFFIWMVYSFKLYAQENVLPTSGNVGIGTLNPSAKLDVNGKMNVDSSIWLKSDVKMTGIQEIENQPISGGNGNNNRKLLLVNSDGLMLCREIKLNQTWAVYVFDTNYQLMPLKEVEKFIQKNKHLPNIPSAKSIEQDGITVNETNRILLEKIEELTLYLIQQQKEIEELKLKINVEK